MSSISTPILGEEPEAALTWRTRLAAQLASPTFERLATVLILLNAITIGLQTYVGLLAGWEASSGWRVAHWLDLFDRTVVGIFTVELIFRIAALGKRFKEDGWNWFDAVVVGVSVLGETPMFSALRVLRVLRILKVFTRFKTMRLLAAIIWSSMLACITISFLMLMVLYVFAIMGHELFAATNPASFGTLHDAMFSLFRVAALFAYDDVITPLLVKHPWAHLYMLPYFMIMSYVIFNFFSAMVVNLLYEVSFDEITGRKSAAAEEEAEEAEQAAPDMARLLAEIQALREDVARLSLKEENA